MSDVFGAGQGVSGVAQAAAMVTVATLQYRTWQSQIDKADAIARRIQDRDDEKHAVWKNVYFPHEQATVAEIAARPMRTPAYAAVAQRVTAQYRSQIDRAKADALFQLDAQCVGARAEAIRSLELHGAGLTAYGVEAALRAEEARTDVINAQRTADRLTVLSHGRQVHHQSGTALQGAIQQAQFAAQQAAGAFNGALSALGALQRRAEQNRRAQVSAPGAGVRGLPNQTTFDRASDEGYGAFPQPGSGDAGALRTLDTLPQLDVPSIDFGGDSGSAGAATYDRPMDTADYGGSV